MEPDFTGWATKADILCSDGRTIEDGAFAHQDKSRVSLVWQHNYDGLDNQLGTAVLKHVQGGMRVEGYFNHTPAGRKAKELVDSGEVNMLSIFADGLVEVGNRVKHGDIQEVSLVKLGANRGALIDNTYLKHGDGYVVDETEAIITTGLALEHANKETNVADNDNKGPSTQEVWDSMSEEQQQLASALVAKAAEEAQSGGDNNDAGNGDNGSGAGGDNNVQHSDKNDDANKGAGDNLQHGKGGQNVSNVFDQSNTGGDATKTGGELRHILTKDKVRTIMHDAYTKYDGSVKKSVLAHAEEYGIGNIEMLFPDAKAVFDSPQFVKRRTEWVAIVMNGVNSTPFSRVKTLFADITHDEARAKGYIKGNVKKEEFFSLSKRVTTPQTVYKKQKLDRDDILDAADIDIVAWLKAEMRLMLEEEVARAILIGDGREVDDEDKIKDPASNADGAGIRSIAHDHEFYAPVVELPSNISGQDAGEYIVRAFDDYRGSGNPTLFVNRGFYNDLLLAKDKVNRRLYSTGAELASALGVDKVVPVDVMEATDDVVGIIVNLRDYNVGTDRGGQTTMFEDFDIDLNQQKYLYETRLSGGLVRWRSAIVIKRGSGTLIQWDNTYVPTFNASTGVVTIPNKTGVTYRNADTGVALTPGAQNAIAAGTTVEVEVEANSGYTLPYNLDTDWEFTRPSA